MELTPTEIKKIQRATRRLERWPMTRTILLVVSLSAIFLYLLAYSVAIRDERPPPSVEDRFILFASSVFSLVVASLCLSKIIPNWKGSPTDRLIVKLAQGQQDKQEGIVEPEPRGDG